MGEFHCAIVTLDVKTPLSRLNMGFNAMQFILCPISFDFRSPAMVIRWLNSVNLSLAAGNTGTVSPGIGSYNR